MKTFLPVMMWGIAVSAASSLGPHLGATADEVAGEETCLPCELFFRKLESTGKDGKMIQDVKVQLRGEPKSGTGMSLDWGTGALTRTCDFLKRLFGEASCQVDIGGHKMFNRTMTFQPALGRETAKCSCDTIERVKIDFSAVMKHTLPLDESCPYRHSNRVDADGGQHRGTSPCQFANGTQVQNYSDLWHCMEEAKCTVNDDWLQMAVYRDPRPVVISAYFYLLTHRGENLGNMEIFTSNELPNMAKWVAMRHILFSGALFHQSQDFWYGDALADPLTWHYRWFDFVGLQLPAQEVNRVTAAAVNNDFSFTYKTVDEHPGQENRSPTEPRCFEDQVSPATLQAANDVLRNWLPPVLLARLGV